MSSNRRPPCSYAAYSAIVNLTPRPSGRVLLFACHIRGLRYGVFMLSKRHTLAGII